MMGWMARSGLTSIALALSAYSAAQAAVVPPKQIEIAFRTCSVTVNTETGPSPTTSSFVIAFEEGAVGNRAVTIFRSAAYPAPSASFDDTPRQTIAIELPADWLADLPALYAAGRPLFVRAVVDPAPGTATGAKLTKLIVYSVMTDKPCSSTP